MDAGAGGHGGLAGRAGVLSGLRGTEQLGGWVGRRSLEAVAAYARIAACCAAGACAAMPPHGRSRLPPAMCQCNANRPLLRCPPFRCRQVLFLLYHYFNAKEIYNAIRVFIAAYVWMTGFGACSRPGCLQW